jgi:hypothetical protein
VIKNRQTGIYGDHIKQKKSGMLRILFQNPQGLGRLAQDEQGQTLKINKLKHLLLTHSIDV